MSEQDFLNELRRDLAAQQAQVANRAGRLTEEGWDVAPGEMAVERLVSHGHFIDHTGELEWTPREVVSHLLDSAQVHIERIARLRTEEEPKFDAFDTTGNERFERYRQAETNQLLQNLERLQEELRRALDSIEPGELDRTGVAPDGTEVTLQEVVEFLPAHESDHADQLAALTSESIA